jgi:hypothetical protein
LEKTNYINGKTGRGGLNQTKNNDNQILMQRQENGCLELEFAGEWVLGIGVGFDLSCRTNPKMQNLNI